MKKTLFLIIFLLSFLAPLYNESLPEQHLAQKIPDFSADIEIKDYSTQPPSTASGRIASMDGTNVYMNLNVTRSGSEYRLLFIAGKEEIWIQKTAGESELQVYEIVVNAVGKDSLNRFVSSFPEISFIVLSYIADNTVSVVTRDAVLDDKQVTVTEMNCKDGSIIAAKSSKTTGIPYEAEIKNCPFIKGNIVIRYINFILGTPDKELFTYSPPKGADVHQLLNNDTDIFNVEAQEQIQGILKASDSIQSYYGKINACIDVGSGGKTEWNGTISFKAPDKLKIEYAEPYDYNGIKLPMIHTCIYDSEYFWKGDNIDTEYLKTDEFKKAFAQSLKGTGLSYDDSEVFEKVAEAVQSNKFKAAVYKTSRDQLKQKKITEMLSSPDMPFPVLYSKSGSLFEALFKSFNFTISGGVICDGVPAIEVKGKEIRDDNKKPSECGIYLGKENAFIYKIIYDDYDKNCHIIMSFKDVKINKNIPDYAFKYHPPQNAQVEVITEN